ncbi:MAG: hypothetical protein ACLVEJ_19785 [Parabacteroides sp.]
MNLADAYRWLSSWRWLLGFPLERQYLIITSIDIDNESLDSDSLLLQNATTLA